jgi:coproporphyrinogen III oxidase-like Fe-S oxidoreductase
MKQLLVYVNIPFCTSKCHFCDWVQQIPASDLRLARGSDERRRYIDALTTQSRTLGARLTSEGYVPAMLYWGGGTASILDPREIRAVMGALREVFDLSGLVEATIESSPETLSPEKLGVFLDEGFGRISVGLQSMNDERLRRIGRAHSAQTGAASVRMAKAAGFDNINIDLISGFPGETLGEFEASIKTALELPVNHVSLYPYRPSDGTVLQAQLSKGRAQIALDEQLRAYALGQSILEGAGLPEYSLSYFGSPKCYSDLAYFQLQMDWVGFGSGAISLLGGELLVSERGKLARYIDAPLEVDRRVPAASAGATPWLMYQALTTREGASAALWKERTGVDLAEIMAQDQVRALLDHFEGLSGVVYDQHGARIPADKTASAFIQHLFWSAPANARTGGAEARPVAGEP